MLRKAVVGGVFTLGLIIFGFIMLLRSCLAKYDERSAISTPQILQQDGKAVVFSLVKFEKATSYSRSGGFIRKSVTTSYYIQTNDGITGAKLQSKKIKKHRQIKSFPVEILGTADNKVWLFAGELMAFDASLNKIADAAAIEAKNPSLKGKLPNERRYFEYDHQFGIRITANDGSPYLLNTSTLIATPAEDEKESDPGIARKQELEKLLKMMRDMNDSNYSRFRVANKLYSERKISQSAYRDSSDRFSSERTRISKLEDSIREIGRTIDDEIDVLREQQQLRNSFSSSMSFSQIKANTDSFNTKWYGLLTKEELDKLQDQFDFRKMYGETDRNKLYTASLSVKDPSKKYSKWIIGEEKQSISASVFLQGGFLLDINTGKPIHLTGPDGFLIVYKEQLGTESKIMLSRIGIDGKQSWSINTGLKDFAHWTISNGRLYLFGVDNKEISSGEINVMHIIDLSNGSIATHDYFKNKNRSR